MSQDYQQLINKLKIEIVLFEQPNAVLARVKIDLVDPPIVIQGYTIRKNEAENKLYVSPPSYPSRFKKFCSIVWSPNDFWKLLENKILDDYKKKTGHLDANDEIDISEIKF
ncbi:MAG: hypothetical protein WCG99_04100 [Candidatus Berkelbacteria bacterium]